MKFYKYLSLAVLFALTLAAGGCSQEDNFPNANGNMVINVYDAGMEAVGGNSRAVTDENYTTVFETGDCIGLFAIKDGAVWNNMNNVKVTYTENGTWASEIALQYDDEQEGVAYYAYYPYQDGKTYQSGTIENFLTKMANEWTPAADQSDKDKFAASDLMTTTEPSSVIQEGSGQFTIRLSMKHRMAMSVLVMAETEYKFSDETLNEIPYIAKEHASMFYMTSVSDENVVRPYLADDGSYRLIIKPSDVNSLIVTQGTYNDKKYEFTASINEGKYQRFLLGGGKKIVEHELKVGDFYCSDGSIVSGNAEEVPENCIGIVYYVGNPQPSVLYPEKVSTDGSQPFDEAHDALRRDHPSCVHGLVYALDYANDVIKVFGTKGNKHDIEGIASAYTSSYLCKSGSREPHYKSILGYNNTEVLKKLADYAIENSADWDLLNMVSCLDSYNKQKVLPSGLTSGWYLPSIEEMRMLINETETINASIAKANGLALWYLNGTEAANDPRGRFNGYWSSSLRAGYLFYMVKDGKEGDSINGYVWNLGYFRFSFAF